VTIQAIRARLTEGSPWRLTEVAAAAGLSSRHVRKLAEAGVLRTFKPGPRRADRRDRHRPTHRRVESAEVARFLRAEGVLLDETMDETEQVKAPSGHVTIH
jgi:hypothetical protein